MGKKVILKSTENLNFNTFKGLVILTKFGKIGKLAYLDKKLDKLGKIGKFVSSA